MSSHTQGGSAQPGDNPFKNLTTVNVVQNVVNYNISQQQQQLQEEQARGIGKKNADLNSSFNSLAGSNRPALSRSFVGGNNFLDDGNSDDEDEEESANNRGGNILDLDIQPVISLQSNNNMPSSLPYR